MGNICKQVDFSGDKNEIETITFTKKVSKINDN